MKKILKPAKKKIFTFVTLAAVLTASVGVTWAMLRANTLPLDNTFTVKPVESEIKEEIGSDMTKKPYVLNTGEADCLVRVRVEVSPSDVEGSLIQLDYQEGEEVGKWTKNEDGFYYYNGYVPKDEMTLSSLFTKAKWLGKDDYSDFVDFDIIIYQETVQTRANDAKGNSISAIDKQGNYDEDNAMAVWNIFDSNL